MGNIKDRAINPNQYDLPDLQWDQMGKDKQSPTRLQFWKYLEEYVQSSNDKDAIDIGSGIGWLLNELHLAGARNIIGIEPSVDNLNLAKKLYPHVKTIESTLQDYSSTQRFDIAFSVMSLVHIDNLDKAFVKVRNLLHKGGLFIAIVPDYDYFKMPRYDYKVEFEDVRDGEYAVSVTRSSGTLADIVRRLELYNHAAKQTGFDLVKHVPMPPTKELIELQPKYEKAKDVALNHLVVYKAK